MHRWLRVLVCLLLVCCILVNLSPLQAEATAGTVATAITLAVGIPVAVAVGLQTVGVRQGSSPSAFNQVVKDCVDALSPIWAVNGLTTMLALTTDGVTKTYANQSFLQALLDFLYDCGILSLKYNAKTPNTYGELSYDQAFQLASEYQYSYVLSFGDVTRILIGYSSPITFSTSSTSTSFSGSGYIYAWSTTDSYKQFYNISSRKYDGVASISSLSGGTVITSEDLTLEDVGDDIETDYETYVEEGIISVDFGVQFEDDPETPDKNEEENNNIPYVPVRIPSTSTDSYTDQTQAEAQTGNTPQDVLDELLQNSGSGDGSGDGSGSDSGSSSGSGSLKPPTVSDNTIRPFLFDISEYFPFCIPFDLYDFFTLLNADPVAPVLSWEIKDLSGNSYPISIDLSEWDSVAQLFRRLQLFLFITGLAAASRKFIKW